MIKQIKGEVYVKMCGNLSVNGTYTDGHVRRHIGLLFEIVMKVTSTVIMHRRCYDTALRLNLIEGVMMNQMKERFI
mgnify:CR=1 FL=1